MDNPVVVSMLVYLVLGQIVPKIINKPTGVQVVDDMVTLLISQQFSLVPATLIVGLSVFLALKIIDSE